MDYNLGRPIRDTAQNLLNTKGPEASISYLLRQADETTNPDLRSQISGYLGSPLNVAGRYQEAVETCQECLSITPDFMPALMALRIAYGALGRVDEAEKVSGRITSLDPKVKILPLLSAEQLVVQGEFSNMRQRFVGCIAQRNYFTAAGRLQAILNHYQVDPQIYEGLFEAAHAATKEAGVTFTSFMAGLSAALRNDAYARDPRILCFLGLVYHRQKNTQLAVKAFEKVLSRDPTNVAALYFLYRIYDRQETANKPRALELAQTLCQLDPSSISYQHLLARARLKIGATEAAVELLQPMVTNGQTDNVTQEMLAQGYLRMWNCAKAITILEGLHGQVSKALSITVQFLEGEDDKACEQASVFLKGKFDPKIMAIYFLTSHTQNELAAFCRSLELGGPEIELTRVAVIDIRRDRRNALPDIYRALGHQHLIPARQPVKREPALQATQP